MLEELIRIARDIVVFIIATSIQFFAYLGVENTAPIPPERSAEHIVPSQITQPKDVGITSDTLPPKNSTPAPTSHEMERTPSVVGESPLPVSSDTYREEEVTVHPPIELPDTLNLLARSALVNILCTTQTEIGVHAVTGSGVIIDSRGVILTNSHVAQYFLLEEKHGGHGYTDCIIRTGSPAKSTYDATPLFISSSWIEENKETIIQEHALGTGEYDVALLLIDTSLTDSPLPDSFPHIPLRSKTEDIPEGFDMLVAGYPAEFLSGSVLSRELWPVTAVTNVIDVYTFGDNTIDLFSVEGNIAAQQGSSGGGVIDITEGTLAGIVVTSSEGKNTDERILNAVTTRHINHAVFVDTNMALSVYLSGDLEERADTFMESVAPYLRSVLLEVIER
jgi:hypothetical protein